MQNIKTKFDENQSTGSKVMWRGEVKTHRYYKYYNPTSRYKIK
jgi:hypothetical protein